MEKLSREIKSYYDLTKLYKNVATSINEEYDEQAHDYITELFANEIKNNINLVSRWGTNIKRPRNQWERLFETVLTNSVRDGLKIYYQAKLIKFYINTGNFNSQS